MTEFKQPPMLADLGKLTPEQAAGKLIERAAALSASDLFLASNEQDITASLRYLGLVQPLAVLPIEQGRRVISHIKARAGMDLTEKRRPMDGRWIFVQGSEITDLRINIVPTIHGEDVALRLLPRGRQLFMLNNVGMTRDQHDQAIRMIESPSGLVLVTGPTGSGKTATLYGCLMRLNNGKRKINTIEDPVEFTIAGIRQSQINPLIDLNFAELLRGVLRQSPDVIMIGEVRDVETAHTAVRAANSGHLVLATIHAPAAAGAIQSMRAMDIHPHFLSTALRGVIAQRLVRTLCPKCKISFDLSDAPHTFDDIRPWLGPDEGKVLYAPKGCEHCQMTGYAARTGIFEVMPITKNLRNLMSEGRPTREVREQAIREKMLEFRDAAMLKVARGETSTEEVFRVIPTEHLVMED